MDKLPKELLTEILKNLPQRDLLNAARVSRTFNEIIGIFCLIEKIYITRADNENPPSRYYKKAIIKNDDSNGYLKAFKTNGESIEEVYFDNLTISINSIAKILNLTPNVKVISFYYTRLENDDEEIEKIVQPLKNVELIFRETNPLIFKILHQVSIKKIVISLYGDSPYYDFNEIQPFMSTQKELKSFDLSGIYECNLMFGVIPKGNYKLQQFSISSSGLEEWHYLEEFLADHTETLEKLTISQVSWDSSSIIRSCKKLKSLTLHETQLNNINDTILSVEELSVQLPIQNISMFPNVKKLHLKQINATENQHISQTLLKVTDLLLVFGAATEISFPNVTKLELMNVNQLTTEFFVHHNKLENLVLRNIFQLDDNILQAIVDNSGKSLRVLRIFGLNNLTARAFAIIKKCIKLKVFETATWTQQFKNDEIKCLYEISGLKIYPEKLDF